MVKLVFARHGESEWNKANLFTGWADVDLSEKGTQQAIDAGKLIKEAGIEFDQAYTSVLKRAIKTTNLLITKLFSSFSFVFTSQTTVVTFVQAP